MEEVLPMTPSIEDSMALRPEVRAALTLLTEAMDYAQALHADPWEFAVELATLLEAGSSRSALRLLLCRGHAVQGTERPRSKTGARIFRRTSGLTLRESACFVLTAKGLAAARTALAHPAVAAPAVIVRPRWDANLRELHF